VNPDQQGRLVLVADDNEDMLRLTCVQLRKAGYSVATAQDGESALAIARERRPAACVLDVMMPGMRGNEVLAALRNDPETKGIPVVLTTATLEDRVFWKLGPKPDDYLRKSSLTRIGGKVTELIESAGGGPVPARSG
jgi:two-component system phosphate regulon response regulator PhoB